MKRRKQYNKLSLIWIKIKLSHWHLQCQIERKIHFWICWLNDSNGCWMVDGWLLYFWEFKTLRRRLRYQGILIMPIDWKLRILGQYLMDQRSLYQSLQISATTTGKLEYAHQTIVQISKLMQAVDNLAYFLEIKEIEKL